MSTIKLPYRFELRDYQVEPWNAVIEDDFHRGVMVVPRRNGKDILCWNLMIAKAMKRRALYFYIGPFYNQIRQIIWEGVDKTGRRFLDYIPDSIVESKTKLDMRITLRNGSQIKLLGSDNIDAIVGTNPFGIVFTEFSLHKPEAWSYLRPILAENGGWALFNGTPRGHNHFYENYNYALGKENWYSQFLTRDDTGIPSLEAIQEDRESGMPEELIQQEYYCSWEAGLVGSYYADIINAAKAAGRIGPVPHEPQLPVYTAWDLGWDDSTTCIFYQLMGNRRNIIDCYTNRNKLIKHYAGVVTNKPYGYREHAFPHDVKVHEQIAGITRLEEFENHGVKPILPIKRRKFLGDAHQEAINNVRASLQKSWIDEELCYEFIEALKTYRREYDPKLKKFKDNPVKDWSVHFADAKRMMAHACDLLPSSTAPWNQPHMMDPRARQLMEQQTRMNELYTDPNNYDPFTHEVHYG